MPRKVWIVQRLPGLAYTTFRGLDGEEVRVGITATRIGPFVEIPAAADWLRKHAIRHASYEIQEERDP